MTDRRRRTGPAPLDAADKRTHCVSVRVNASELALLDSKRGPLQRGEWLRTAALDKLPPPAPPELNREAWAVLSKCSGNLATLATAMRSGEYIDAAVVDREVRAFRAALLGVKLP